MGKRYEYDDEAPDEVLMVLALTAKLDRSVRLRLISSMLMAEAELSDQRGIDMKIGTADGEYRITLKKV